MSTFAAGDRVYLVTPENATLDGQLAVVEVLAGWGAHVVSVAPTWPGSTSGRYRALWVEMVPAREAVPVSVGTQARVRGYTGDACGNCGSFSVVRTGTCATCQACGHSVGGCV